MSTALKVGEATGPLKRRMMDTIIPSLLGWHGYVQVHDRNADPDTLH
jgi:hypothetical protein